MALAVIDQLYYDITRGASPEIIHVSGDIYAIAYMGPNNDGWLKTVNIDSAGEIGAVIGEWEFDPAGGSTPFIIHISGTVYAIAYNKYTGTDTNYNGTLITFNIAADGTIGSLIDTSVFDALRAASSHMIHISGDIYAIAFESAYYDDGRMVTVEIDSAGNIINPSVDTRIYDGRTSCLHPYLIHISGTTYAIGYSRGVITITIGNDGTIGAELDSVDAYYPHEIVHVAGDVYAIVRNRWIETLTIDAAGNIRDTAIASLEYDANASGFPILLQSVAGPFAIIYSGSGLDGYIKTVNIESDGTIGAILETLEYDTSQGWAPSAVEVASGIIAIAYNTSSNYGRMKTVGPVVVPTVSTNPATSVVAGSIYS